MANYLDEQGLRTLWGKIKEYNGHISVKENDEAVIEAISEAGSDDLKSGDLFISADTGRVFAITGVKASSSGTYGWYTVKQISEDDIESKQNKDLEDPITVDGTQETTVEGALGALNEYVSDVDSDTANNSAAIANLGVAWDSATHSVVKATQPVSGAPSSAQIPLGTSGTPGLVKPGAVGDNSATHASNALSSDKIVLGNGNGEVKTSGVGIANSVENSTTQVPTGSAVSSFVGNEISKALQSQISIYVVEVTGTFTQTDINAQLATDSSDVTVISVTASQTIRAIAGPVGTTYPDSIPLINLKLGDVIYIKETNYPDRWVSTIVAPSTSESGSVVFSRLETQDLSAFVIKPDSALTGEDSKTITSIGVDSNGKLTATFTDIAIEQSAVNGLPGALSGKAPLSHSHGNITNEGAITSDTTIATGDKIAITDALDSNKVARGAIAFDTSVTDRFLNQAGQWVDISGQGMNKLTYTVSSVDSEKILNLMATDTASSSGNAQEASIAVPTGLTPSNIPDVLVMNLTSQYLGTPTFSLSRGGEASGMTGPQYFGTYLSNNIEYHIVLALSATTTQGGTAYTGCTIHIDKPITEATINALQ